MQSSALFGAKNSALDFSTFVMCPHGQGEREGELSQCGHFADYRG